MMAQKMISVHKNSCTMKRNVTVITSDYVAILFISNEMLIVYGEIIGIFPRPKAENMCPKMIRCCDNFSVVERAE